MKLKNLSEIPRLAMRPLHEFENIPTDHFIARALNAPIDSKNESIKGQPRTKGHEQINLRSGVILFYFFLASLAREGKK